jgi:hypothetical protein
VDDLDFEHVFEVYLNCKEAGLDAYLSLHCSGCISDSGCEPAEFGFRAPGRPEYTVTLPDMDHVLFGVPLKDIKRSPQGYQDPWDYAVAASFIKAMTDERVSAARRCGEWLDTVRDGSLYRGRPWDVIFSAIDDILGVLPE